MPLYEIVKSDGTREKVSGDYEHREAGMLTIGRVEVARILYHGDARIPLVTYAPGTWLEVWRREGVGGVKGERCIKR